MESNWTTRLCLACLLLLVLAACDYLGAILEDAEAEQRHQGVKHRAGSVGGQLHQRARSPPSFLEDGPGRLDVVTEDDDDEAGVGADALASKQPRSVRADCLPKLVCELAGQPETELGSREKHLLDMIRSSGIGNTAEVASRWHFAVHMGQLLADTQGCAALWSGCPLAHDTLLDLARRLTLKR